MAIVIVPPYPQRNDPNFATVADSWNAQLPTWTDQVNATAVTMAQDATTATTQAGIATTQAGIATTQAGLATTNGAAQVALAASQVSNASVFAANAAASASSAAITANASKWISGASYNEGSNVWSPSDYKTYRRKITGSGTTDPSIDTTNWESLIASPPMLTLITSVEANNVASVDFTGFSSMLYRRYIVEFYNVPDILLSKLQVNNNTWLSLYDYMLVEFSATKNVSGSFISQRSDAYNSIYYTQGDNGCLSTGNITINNPVNITDTTTINYNNFCIKPPTVTSNITHGIIKYDGKITGIRFYNSSANLSKGTFNLYGSMV